MFALCSKSPDIVSISCVAPPVTQGSRRWLGLTQRHHNMWDSVWWWMSRGPVMDPSMWESVYWGMLRLTQGSVVCWVTNSSMRWLWWLLLNTRQSFSQTALIALKLVKQYKAWVSQVVHIRECQRSQWSTKPCGSHIKIKSFLVKHTFHVERRNFVIELVVSDIGQKNYDFDWTQTKFIVLSQP